MLSSNSMPALQLHNKPIETIFQLLGEKENTITYSVGWALYRSPTFLKEFLKARAGEHQKGVAAVLRLQDYRKKSGITDIEIEAPGQYHLIVEAKCGWNLPRIHQLEKYIPRLKKRKTEVRKIVALSECDTDYASTRLTLSEIVGVPIQTISWREIAGMVKRAIKRGKLNEKHLLKDLLAYLGRVTTMQDTDSNWVYVVAVGAGTHHGWRVSWIDMIDKYKRYFHPVGINGWPKEPPNYIAFRYHGRLQSIHHIKNYTVLTDLHDGFKEIPHKKREPHFLYGLGPAIRPAHRVPTGKLYANGRVWCMFDTLLSSKTIAQARDTSKKREKLARKQYWNEPLNWHTRDGHTFRERKREWREESDIPESSSAWL
jgi:hypothetical protein